MRLILGDIIQVDRPYQGDGVSVYAQVGTSIDYRKPRIFDGPPLRLGDPDDYQDFPSTQRVGSESDPTETHDFSIPASWLPGVGETEQVAFDVRRFRNDVELPSEGPVVVEIDENGDEVTYIDGTAELLSTTLLAGGDVRLRFRYYASDNGTAPEEFRMTRTSGPSSPSDQTVAYSSTKKIYEITFESLSDASAYEFDLIAEANSGAVTKTLISPITFTADASGPPAVSSVVQEVV